MSYFIIDVNSSCLAASWLLLLLVLPLFHVYDMRMGGGPRRDLEEQFETPPLLPLSQPPPLTVSSYPVRS